MNSTPDIPAARQNAHHLDKPRFTAAEDLVGWMGAVQAQDYRMARWAVGMRLAGNAPRASVERALSSGRIVRTHILRPTWHFVRSEDLRWMREISARSIISAVAGFGKGGGRKLTESIYLEANRRFRAILADGRERTKQELRAELVRGGWEIDLSALTCLTIRAEADGILCSGADRDGKPTYALLEDRIPDPGTALRGDAALARLAEMYFRSHGPATLRDFAWWSGLSVSRARRAMEAARRTARGGVQHTNGRTEDRTAGGKNRLHLLPAYDEYLIGYKDRSDVLEPRYFSKAFNRFGVFRPVILYGGRVVGNWSDAAGRMSACFFEPECSVKKECLDAAMARYRAFRAEGK